MRACVRVNVSVHAPHARALVSITASLVGHQGRSHGSGQPIERVEQFLFCLLIFAAHTHALVGVKDGRAKPLTEAKRGRHLALKRRIEGLKRQSPEANRARVAHSRQFTQCHYDLMRNLVHTHPVSVPRPTATAPATQAPPHGASPPGHMT